MAAPTSFLYALRSKGTPTISPIMDRLRCYLCDSMLCLGEFFDHLKTHAEELQQEGAALDQALKAYLEAFQIAAILFEDIE